MSPIDIVLLAAVLAVAAWWIVAPRAGLPLLRLAPIALVVLAVAQILLEEVYWQFLPAYALIVVLGLMSILRREARPHAGLVRLSGQAGLAALMLAALAPFMLLLPVPALTKPDGPYAVGSEIFRWVDASRAEAATDDPSDSRNVIAQAWYPASTAMGVSGRRPVYIDGLGRLPSQVSLIPDFVMRSYGRIDTHALVDAPVSDAQTTWPVVLFSPGYGAPRAFYTSLATGLASRGYIVLAIDHPYESAVTELADGTIATDANVFAKYAGTDEGGRVFMARQHVLRAADMRFVLDQLSQMTTAGLLGGRLDFSRVAAIGHSFGGASAAYAMAIDPRIGRAVNIDGTFYGDVPGQPAQHPLLFIESDHVETGHADIYFSGKARLFAHFGGGASYELKRANHFSFTDAPLFLAPPGRLAVAMMIGGARGPTDTHHVTIDLLDGFLKGENLDAAAARHKDVRGGPAH